MSQVLVRGTEERTEYRMPPVPRRRPVVGYTLTAVGLLVVLVGLYFQFAPSSWWLADLSEAYYLGSYTLGGLFMGTGFGVVAHRLFVEDGGTSARMITLTVLAVAAIGGAAVASYALLQSPAGTADDVAGSDRHLAVQAEQMRQTDVAGSDRHLAVQAEQTRRTDVAGSDRHLTAQAQVLEDTAR